MKAKLCYLIILLPILSACSFLQWRNNGPAQTPVTSAIEVTETSVPTPNSELTLQEMEQKILSMIEGTRFCRLPCLWDLVPGLSKKPQETVFSRFSDLSDSSTIVHTFFNEGNGSTTMLNNEDNGLLATGLRYSLDANETVEFVSVFTDFQLASGWPGFGQIEHDRLFHAYLPSQLLANYSSPSQIYAAVLIADTDISVEHLDFLVILFFYPDLGALVEYVSLASQVSGTTYSSCPANSLVEIITWDSKVERDLSEVVGHLVSARGISVNNFSLLLPIEQVLDTNISEFINTITIAPETCFLYSSP